MQVAVPRMKHVHAAQIVLRLHDFDRKEHLRELAARDGRIHAHVVRTDASRGREGVLAAAPEFQALRLVAAHLDARCAALGEDAAHRGDLLLDFPGSAVALTEQDGCRGQIVARVHEVLRHLRHAPVHELETRGNDALCDHARDGSAGSFHCRKARQHAARELRPGYELDRHFGGNREHALTADDDGQQVEAGHIERFRAELDGLPRGRQAAHTQHVVQRQTVLQAMHTAGILGNVATDGAGDLTARVGRVVKAERSSRLADRQVAHPALNHGRTGQWIEREDFVEFRERDGDSPAVGKRAAR